MSDPLYCSFCGKSQHEVRKLIAGPTVFICDACVEVCRDIVAEAEPQTVTEALVRVAEAAGQALAAYRAIFGSRSWTARDRAAFERLEFHLDILRRLSLDAALKDETPNQKGTS
jgi:hypothetical protein